MPAPPKRARGSDGSGGKRSKDGVAFNAGICASEDVVLIESSSEDEVIPAPKKRAPPGQAAARPTQGTAPRGGGSGKGVTASGNRSGASARRRPGSGSSGAAAGGTKQLKLNFQPQSRSLASLLLSPPSSQGGGDALPGSATASQQQPQQQQQQQQQEPPPSPSGLAAPTPAAGGMWVDSHAPKVPEELAVHAKKVQEVKAWLEGYQAYRSRGTRAWVLLVTGPTGCGKSTTVRVVAEAMGFEVVEWAAPVPTLWSDLQYQGAAGLQYQSKLDDFDAFVAHSKLSVLPFARAAPPQPQPQPQPLQQLAPSAQAGAAGGSQPPTQQPRSEDGSQRGAAGAVTTPAAAGKLLLLDDLPYVGDAERRQRLTAALRDLCVTCRCPVVLITTETSGGGGGARGGYGGDYGGGFGGGGDGGAMGAMGGYSKGLHKDVLSLLDSLGAATITFNPVTANALAKALVAAAAKEGLELPQHAAAAIAQAADGDLRNAMQSLQVYAGGRPRAAAAAASARGRGAGAAAAAAAGKGRKRPAAGGGKAKRGAADAAAAAGEQRQIVGRVARDQRLSLYHALGKLLHNKRDWADSRSGGGGAAAATAAAAAAAEEAEEPRSKPKRPRAQRAQQQEGEDGAEAEQGGGGFDFGAAAQPLGPLPGVEPRELREELRRPPMRYDPESILQQSALDAATVTAFLAENYTSFVSDGAIADLAAVAAYISDAGFLAHRRNSAASTAGFWDESDTTAATLTHAAAGSIAARGVLFANAHPAPSSWQPLRGPTCSLPERAANENLEQLSAAARRSHITLGSARCGALACGGAAAAAGALPFLRALARAPSRAWLAPALPATWTYIWQGALSRSEAAGGAAEAEARALASSLAAAGLLDGGGGSGGGSGAGGGAEGGGGDGEADEIEED